MAEQNIDDIRKLPLKARLSKLKEYEETRIKELEAAAKLIKESLEQQRRQDVAQMVEVPEPVKVDISDLFKSDEKTLEAVIGREIPQQADEQTVKYELQLDYQILTKLDLEMDRYKLQKAVLQVEDRVNEIASKVDYANLSKDVADQLVATRSVLYTMKKRTGM